MKIIITQEMRWGGVAGMFAGLLTAAVTGAPYILENAASAPHISWATVGTVFVAELALAGAAFGALVRGATTLVEERIGRRAWTPPVIASLVTAIVATPAAAFGAVYFGSLNAPFMGNTVIFAMSALIAVSLAVSMACLDQKRLSKRALVASILLAIPVVLIGGGVAASVPDDVVLHAFRSTSVPLLGALSGAGLGLIFGLYSGLVVSASRRRRGARIRVADADLAPLLATKKVDVKADEFEEAFVDPLAEEDAELAARFAALESADVNR